MIPTALCILAVGGFMAISRNPVVGWRVQLIHRKLIGQLAELSWGELFATESPSRHFYRQDALVEGRSLEAALIDPYTSAQDRTDGERIFRDRCSVCHGSDAKGGRGPSLVTLPFREGSSDFAIYRTLRDGVKGTAMVPTNLSAVERWQEVSYLRSLQGRVSSNLVRPVINVSVSDRDLREAGLKSDKWLTYSGSYSGWRYSSDTQITPENVSRLRLRWVRQLPTEEENIESTPLIVDGVMFVTVPPTVMALNAGTGQILWEYRRVPPNHLPICCGQVNRGVAILGSTLFVGTLDAHLVALDAATGRVKWDAKVADSAQGYSITGAPLVVDGAVVVGVSGGEFGVRGLIAAYNVVTGAQRWRFDTIPGPGSQGHETWKSDAWRNGGGPAWMTGSFDPALNLLYWGIGNPSPVYAGDLRPGDNLFTNSVVALRADTGRLVWYFQFSPHDEHDWDSAQTPILADISIGAAVRQLMLFANRNGFYYVLDRVNGAFVTANAFVRQTWADGIDAKGRPRLSVAGHVSERGTMIYPSIAGGTNWQSPAFDPKLQLYFVPATEGASIYSKSQPDRVERVPGQLYVGSGGAFASQQTTVIRALDAKSGTKVWEYFPPPDHDFGHSGLLATGGEVVFGSSGGILFALDSKTGTEKWKLPLGGSAVSAPLSVNSDGQQTIFAIAGKAIFAFAL
jgi:alcohol dehydrogenase (cytochrome c)